MTPRGGAAAVTPAASAAAREEEKSSIDPKIFVVVGLLIAAAVIGSFTTGIIGGPGGDPDTTLDVNQISGSSGSGGSGSGGTTGPPPRLVNPVQPPRAPSGTGNTQTTTDTGGGAAQMRVIVSPDPRQPIGTMGIIVSTPNVTPVQALNMAKSAKQAFERGGKWTGMQVVVFNNQAAAIAFRQYQARRNGQGLTPYQYEELANQGLWSSVPAFYETRGKTGVPYYPANSPQGWWTRR